MNAHTHKKTVSFLKARRTTLLKPNNIIIREMTVTLSAVIAVSVGQALIPLLGLIGALASSRPFVFDIYLAVDSWTGGMIILSLLLGVLCGAEEEENNTANFVRRLPIARLRVLGEKICGSAFALIIGIVLSFLCTVIVILICDSDPGMTIMTLKSEIVSYKNSTHLITWGPLLYFAGLAAGAWIEKVVIAAVAGGIGAWLYAFLFFFIFYGGLYRANLTGNRYALIFWAGSLLALLITAIRYQLHEGK